MPRNAPESVHDRLNRELYRDYVGGWRLWLALLAVLGLVFVFIMPGPSRIDYVTGTVTGVTTLVGETGPIIRIGVQTASGRVEAGTRARLVAPTNGESVCLARREMRWTGGFAYSLTALRLCEGSEPTPDVE